MTEGLENMWDRHYEFIGWSGLSLSAISAHLDWLITGILGAVMIIGAIYKYVYEHKIRKEQLKQEELKTKLMEREL